MTRMVPTPSTIATREQIGNSTPVSEQEVERSLARLKAAMTPDLLVLFSLFLDAMAKERAHGALSVDLNMHAGVVKSADFHRRNHWQQPKGE